MDVTTVKGMANYILATGVRVSDGGQRGTGRLCRLGWRVQSVVVRCILVDSHHEPLSKGGRTVGVGVSWLFLTTSRSGRVEGQSEYVHLG